MRLYFRIPLNAPVESIAGVAALRSSLENLIARACEDPESTQEPTEMDQTLMSVVRAMCKPSAATVGVENVQEVGGPM